MSLRVLVTGGRKFHNQRVVDAALDDVFALHNGKLTVIHGGASGADACAHAWVFAQRARGAHVGFDVYRANWRLYGTAAGPIRNRRMIREGQPDLCVAFPGGDGTADCVAQCKAAGIEVLLVGAEAWD